MVDRSIPNWQLEAQVSLEGQGLVWQPYAMGGGQWVEPQVVRLSEHDVARIADAVVRKLQGADK
jgi:hypothetical protein